MSDKSNNEPSTVGSYVDSAIGAAQKFVGDLTGNTADSAQGQNRKDAAKVENDASHAAAKAGPFTLSSSGAIAQDSSDRTTGNWNQTIGAAKEALGGLVGAEGLRQEGIRQNREGKGQEAQGQLSDLGKGIGDRVTGTVGGAVAGLTGNVEEQQKRQDQHDVGKTLQRGVEHDLQKEADAQSKDTNAQQK